MLGENPAPLLFTLPQIPHGLLWTEAGFSRQEAEDKP